MVERIACAVFCVACSCGPHGLHLRPRLRRHLGSEGKLRRRVGWEMASWGDIAVAGIGRSDEDLPEEAVARVAPGRRLSPLLQCGRSSANAWGHRSLHHRRAGLCARA